MATGFKVQNNHLNTEYWKAFNLAGQNFGFAGTSNYSFPVAYGGGTWVCIGNVGHCAYSTDNGTTWTYTNNLRSSGFNSTYVYTPNCFKYNATLGHFAVIDVLRNVAISADGINWSTSTSLNTAWGGGIVPYGFAVSSTVGVVVGSSGKVATSTDGVNFTNQTGLSSLPEWGTQDVRAVEWNGSVFLAIGNAGTAATSPDGVTWTYRAGLSGTSWGTSNGRVINWNGSKFLIGSADGKSAYSTDGITWTAGATFWNNTEVDAIAWGNSKYVLAIGAAQYYYTSSDGITWSSYSIDNASSGYNNNVVFGNGVFMFISQNIWQSVPVVFVSSTGVFTASDSKLRLSVLGLNSGTGSPNYNFINGSEGPYVAYFNGNYLFFGNMGRLITCDQSLQNIKYVNKLAETWIDNSNPSDITPSTQVNYFATNGQVLVVIGPNGFVATSTNANNQWTYQPGLRSTTWGSSGYPITIKWNGSLFYLIGSYGRMATSPDGITWTYNGNLATAMGTYYPTDFYILGNKIVVICTSGGLFTRSFVSNDGGTTWTSAAVTGSTDISGGITYGKGKFVACTRANEVFYSTDGLNWTLGTCEASNVDYNINLLYNNIQNKFILCSRYGYLYTSDDGTNFKLDSYNNLTNNEITGSNFTRIFNSFTHPDNSTSMASMINSSGFKMAIAVTNSKDLDDLLVRRDLFSEGNLLTWGLNSSGQLGDGTTTNRSSPGTVAGGGTNWKQVSMGGISTYGIKTDGTLWTWGSNFYGQLGDGTTTNRSSPGTVAGGGTNWKQVSGGYLSTAAIKTDGTLWTWGSNNNGQLGDNTTTSRSSPGTVAGGGTTWKQVSGCSYGCCAAIKADGTLWTWGLNTYGQLGDGTTTDRSSPGTVAGGATNWKQVSAGTYAMCAIKVDGTLWTWGYNGYGQLGDGTTTSRSSPGTVAGGGTNWKQVNIVTDAAASNHVAAIKTDGTLWLWGDNEQGKLGDNTTSDRSSPVTTAGGGTNWKQVSCGNGITAAIKVDGTLWTWGNQQFGSLGTNNATPSRSSPGTVVGGFNTWKQVDITQSVCAIQDTSL